MGMKEKKERGKGCFWGEGKGSKRRTGNRTERKRKISSQSKIIFTISCRYNGRNPKYITVRIVGEYNPLFLNMHGFYNSKHENIKILNAQQLPPLLIT